VLVNYGEYESVKDTLDVLSDPVSMRQIAQSKSFYAKRRQGESFEAVFGEPLIARKRRKK
jgi:PHD/YefM family antitoxin component YafN of YafNO toxin-antitoxin module